MGQRPPAAKDGRSVQEVAQLARAALVVLELAQRLVLDLADALAGDAEVAADLLERVLAAVDQPLAELQHHRLALVELAERLLQLLGEDVLGGLVDRRLDVLVGDEVAVERVLLVADGRFQRERLARELERLLDLLGVPVGAHGVGDLGEGRLARQLLLQPAAGAGELVDRLDHVHRDADGARLVGDGAVDGLPDPPGGVGGELVAAAVLELLDGADEALVALLEEVEEAHAAAVVLLGDADDQAQVGLDEVLARQVAVLDDALQAAPRAVVELGALLLEASARLLAGLDAASQVDLLLEGEELDAPDLLQVLAHRVVGLDAGVGHGLGARLELLAVE